MKLLKNISQLFFRALIILSAGLGLGIALGVAPIYPVVALALLGAIPFTPVDALRVGLAQDLWTAELLRNFRHQHTWVSRLPEQNDYVDNDAIHLVDVGSDPDVLINNNVYPIPTKDVDDQDLVVKLKKFDTTNHRITDKDLYAVPYDVQGSKIRQHREKLEEFTAEYGLFSVAPNDDSPITPIVTTTGSNNGNGFKKAQIKDLIQLKKRFDDAKIPMEDRILILSNQHVQDLLEIDQKFREQFQNIRTGQIMRLYGFDIFQSPYNPVYDSSNNKRPFGAASQSSDRDASIAIYTPRAFRATGTVQTFIRERANDPDMRENKLGFQLRHIILPKKFEGMGALVSDSV